MSSVETSPTGIPLVKEWAKAQYQAALKERNELAPLVKHNRKLTLISAGLAYLFWFGAIPFPAPQSVVFMVTGIIFFLMSTVIGIRGARTNARYDAAKWEMETMSIALRLGMSIGEQAVAEVLEKEAKDAKTTT